MRHERLCLSISTLPWGYVWTVSIQTLTEWDRRTPSALLLMESWILHGVTAPSPAPRHAVGRPTNCSKCCACEFLPLTPRISRHILGVTSSMKCKLLRFLPCGYPIAVVSITVDGGAQCIPTAHLPAITLVIKGHEKQIQKLCFIFAVCRSFLITVGLTVAHRLFSSALFYFVLFCTVRDIIEIGFLI